jgi:hypothetical protein
LGLRRDSTVRSESKSLGTFTFLDTRAFFPFALAGQTVSALDLAVERVDVIESAELTDRLLLDAGKTDFLSRETRSRVMAHFSSAPDRIRTCDLRFRRPTLYPTELRARARHSRGAKRGIAGPDPHGLHARASYGRLLGKGLPQRG